MLNDPRFATVPDRMEHIEEIRTQFRQAAADIPDGATFEQRFAANQLAVGTVRSARDLAESDWAAERKAIASVTDRGEGTIRVPNAPWRFDDVPTEIPGEPRYRGEDNWPVLRELLGYDDAAIDALEANGVISSRVPQSRD